jgi:hypothetical protein
MGPFRDHQQALPASVWCHRSARCDVCSGRDSQVRRQFFAIVGQAWNQTKMTLLTKAANSALL